MNNKYIESYEKIFADNEFKAILYSFSDRVWSNLTVEKRLKLIVSLEEITSKHFNLRKVGIALKNDTTSGYGTYNPNNNVIYFSKELINSGAFSVLSTYFHEKRHDYQMLAMEGIVKEDPLLVKQFKDNTYITPIGRESNYIKGGKDINLDRYLLQPVEKDANEIAIKLTLLVAKKLQSKLEKDNASTANLLAAIFSDEVFKEGIIDEGFYNYYIGKHCRLSSFYFPKNQEAILLNEKYKKEIHEQLKEGFETRRREVETLEALYNGEKGEVSYLCNTYFSRLLLPEKYNNYSGEIKVYLLKEAARRIFIKYDIKNNNIEIELTDKGEVRINDKTYKSNDGQNHLGAIKTFFLLDKIRQR